MLDKVYDFKRIVLDSYRNLHKKKLYYIVEDANWSIKHDGIMITSRLPFKACITTVPYGIRKSIIHFGSFNCIFSGQKLGHIAHSSNKIIATVFHLNDSDSRIGKIRMLDNTVDLWHTSCQITRAKLLELRVPAHKIKVIPLGVDIHNFQPATVQEKINLRKQHNIPVDSVVIGSFQKDGEGWNKGLEPKYIKGPDVFCDAVEKIATKLNVFVILTGPARGYVVNRLKKAGINFLHRFLEAPSQVAKFYKCCDIYIIGSRNEGGPKSLLESMASGVPVITTKVGMAPDIIENRNNGMLTDIEDVDAIVDAACEIFDEKKLKIQLIDNGLETSMELNWENIAKRYCKELYHF